MLLEATLPAFVFFVSDVQLTFDLVGEFDKFCVYLADNSFPVV